MPLQLLEEGTPSPYMDPSPVLGQKPLNVENQFRERADTGSSVFSSKFNYVPPEVRHHLNMVLI